MQKSTVIIIGSAANLWAKRRVSELTLQTLALERPENAKAASFQDLISYSSLGLHHLTRVFIQCACQAADDCLVVSHQKHTGVETSGDKVLDAVDQYAMLLTGSEHIVEARSPGKQGKQATPSFPCSWSAQISPIPRRLPTVTRVQATLVGAFPTWRMRSGGGNMHLSPTTTVCPPLLEARFAGWKSALGMFMQVRSLRRSCVISEE